MKKVLVSFADINYSKQQNYLTKSACSVGKFDDVHSYGTSDVLPWMAQACGTDYHLNRGFGYWVWKPYLILKSMNRLNDGDIIFYSDAASYFIKPIDQLISKLKETNKCVMVFEGSVSEIHYSKMELIRYLNITDPLVLYTNQIIASYMLIEVSKESRYFLRKYLELCLQDNLINDSLDDKIQNPFFTSHRHDQSILSLLSKTHPDKVTVSIDPSQYGLLKMKYVNYTIQQKGIALQSFNRSTNQVTPIMYQYRKTKAYENLTNLLFRIKLVIQLNLSRLYISAFKS